MADEEAGPAPRRRVVLDAESRPALARFVKFRHDPQRGRWILLAPERVLTPSDTAVAVLKLCDGERSIAAIAAELAREYDAAAGDILGDVTGLLQGLADKGYVVA